MTKFTATFKSGKQITKITADGFRNRLDFTTGFAKIASGKLTEALWKLPADLTEIEHRP